MTINEFQNRKEILKKDKIQFGEFGFNDQKPMEFLKIDIFEVTIDKDSFHWQSKWKNENGRWVKTEGVVDWDKNYVLMLGGLCGIESEHSKSEKMGKYSYLSKSTCFRLMPSGKKEYESAEYEFDAEVRGEEVILKNEIAFMEYNQKKDSGTLKQNDREVKQKYKSDLEKKLVTVEMAKFGRQRADTGAHKRAICKMIKLPSASEELIGTHLFCFQCVPDFSNGNVRDLYLSKNNPASSVFGNTPQISDNSYIEEAEPKNITLTAASQISEKRESLKSNAVLYKLAGLVLDKEEYAEDFLNFLKNYNHLQDKNGMLLEWICKFGDMGEVKPGETETVLKNWGNS